MSAATMVVQLTVADLESLVLRVLDRHAAKPPAEDNAVQSQNSGLF
jgi:hypothetical protein